jgi:N-acetylneuraminic acid mutarotase
MGTVRYAPAAAVIDGLLYVIGGNDGSSRLSSGERYDPAANAWSPIASMGTAREFHTAVAIDGLLYAIGGYSGHSRLSSGERYDPAADAWSPIASMGTARHRHAAAVIDGLLYATGGWNPRQTLEDAFSSGERYDPAANAWSPIAFMGTGRKLHASAAL